MITLIAESKTMTSSAPGATSLASTLPEFGEIALSIMASVMETPLPELQERLGLSAGLTVKMQEMALHFGAPDSGTPAIEAYTGEVFKALDYNSLSDSGRSVISSSFRIISSLYGLLLPTDKIRPYRLNFDSCPPYPGMSLTSFWKKHCTLALGRQLKASGENALINLLPGDAAKYIDWKLIRGMVRVIVPVIKQINSGGKQSTPPAGKLKKIRGIICRAIAENNIRTVDDFLRINTEETVFSGEYLYPDYPVFLC